MDIEYAQLPNGLRIAHLANESPVAHCGLFIPVGTRREQAGEAGMAHFIEHMIFKGTEKRKTYHILSRLEDVGGELNAYTTKEETVIHASFLKSDYGRALELIADILYKSTFPVAEIAKEQAVIIDEINTYEDTPSELIFESFEEKLFAGHALAHRILGTPDSVRALTRQRIQQFIHRNYALENMVLVSVGSISMRRFRGYLERYFEAEFQWSSLVGGLAEFVHQPVKTHTFHEVEAKAHQQCHAILGKAGPGATSNRVTTAILLSNVLGGPMNSRLNMLVREKHGLTYHIESFYQAYAEVGVFGVYLGADAAHLERSIALVRRVFREMMDRPMGVNQLRKAKKQVLGQLAINADHNNALMLGIGRSMLLRERMESWEEIADRVERITAADIQEMAEELLQLDGISTLVYRPKN